ncbi:LacI family transcriptional regulator [Nakamurella silvestris]|nr:LacI family transcriptional regulator [Nakamurella silvestris]
MSGDMSRSAPTLEVVAALAGVSRATASRVLSGTGRSSSQAQEAVLAAAEKLGYVPNLAARSLVTRRSDAVAFVVAEDERTFFADPFFPTLLQGAQEVVADRGLQLMFMIVRDEPSHRRLVNYAAGGHLDGVMLVSLHGTDTMPQDLEARGIPVVLVGRPIVDEPLRSYVDADNQGGAASATELLVARGCRRIAAITGPMDMAVGQDRQAGYRRALADAGISYDESLVAAGDFSRESGERAMRELLAAEPAIDGLFAANDLMALGAMSAIGESGRSVPGDVAVVGFDDTPLAAQTRPALTTVRQPIAELGRAMAQCLLDRIAGSGRSEPVIVQTEIVHRTTA